MKIWKFTTPLDEKTASGLRAGDHVLITGELIVSRDEVHRRFFELISGGKPLPVDLTGQIIYYCGPSPAPEGHPVGSAGPTTSIRMDGYTPALLEHGLKGMIGKGERTIEVCEALKRFGAVYFTALGGGGALLSLHIKNSRIAAYEELGPEALRIFTVESFPAIVACDSHGGNLYSK